ncbi:MAG TPA: DUF2089 domain-containing protein [Phycisphaerales bacterium]|nr:DUF2089 domain-containing protein [Phycisphaerales bacterium]
MKRLPTMCPACNDHLKVKNLICEQCETEIQGQYELPPLAGLCPDDQAFVLDFMKASGSLKEMAKLLGLSYPTVRNRLDEIIERLKFAENPEKISERKNHD